MKKISILTPVVCALALASCTFTPNNLLPSQDGSAGTSQADSSQGGGSQGGGSQADSSQAPQGNMNRAQANLLLSEAVAHISSPSLALPSKYHAQEKTEVFSKDDSGAIVGTIGSETLVDYDGDAKRCAVATIVNLGPSLSGESYSWIWSDSEQGYYAESASLTDFSDASYSEIPLEDYEDAFASLSSDYALDKEDIASDMATVISLFSSIEQMLSDDGTVTTENTTVTYDLSKKELAETYNSTGAGNLSAKISLAIAGTITTVYTEEGETQEGVQTVDGEIELNFLMNDYLPVTLDLQEDVDTIIDGEEQNMNVHMETQYNWGTCTFTAPDLSLFPEQGLPQGELNRQQAMEFLMDAMIHAFDDSFVIPSKYIYHTKNEVYLKDADGEITDVNSNELIVHFDGEEKVCSTMSIFSSGEENPILDLGWIWREDGHAYTANNPSFSDFYNATLTEIPLDEYDDVFASFASDYALNENAIIAPTSMVLGLLSSIEKFLIEEPQVYGDTEVCYSLTTKDICESYYSSGEGNLSLSVDFNLAGTVSLTNGESVATQQIQGMFRLRLVLQNYLPVECLVAKDLFSIAGEEYSNDSFENEYEYIWGKCEFTTPPLSLFPKQGNEGGEGQAGADGEI